MAEGFRTLTKLKLCMDTVAQTSADVLTLIDTGNEAWAPLQGSQQLQMLRAATKEMDTMKTSQPFLVKWATESNKDFQKWAKRTYSEPRLCQMFGETNGVCQAVEKAEVELCNLQKMQAARVS